ncbi:2-oxo-4-hydroxy-4-carboxy-5-ureidoimidazoline decarboxylase [Calidifontibacter indicus]|uniref:2-oxo-4-hydroxy-4-carboxy-5-ureidoimidazoline decarboxylase n=1 Tax=Calidifontibacter indicus TaxID=419650 RepID=UPI003D7187E9
MTTPSSFNALSDDQVDAALRACLPVDRWVAEVAAGRPYDSRNALLHAAESAAARLDDDELAAALAGHPRIGEPATSPEHQAEASAKEQAGVDRSDAAVMHRLQVGNQAYEDRFDRVFLIRAKGRTATEILAELERRLENDDETEREETVTQLRQIALLRLEEVAH